MRQRIAVGVLLQRFARAAGERPARATYASFAERPQDRKMNIAKRRVVTCGFALALLALQGCAATYLKALETVGFEKRDILVNRIESARDEQASAREHFASALDHYREIVEVDGGEIERIYERLDRDFERSQRSAKDVSDRIDAVRTVASSLFKEWEDEIDNYSDRDLKSRSERLYRDTRSRYQRVINAMERAERSMEPVLTLLNDRVMFARHNLNAIAIGALDVELERVEDATEDLIDEMERAIREADQFIATMV
jgi:hypothetical protein